MEKEFEYNGYTFRPLGKKEMTFEEACRRIESDRDLGISAYEWRKGDKNNYDEFYMASGNSKSDLFLCLGNGKVYIPGNNELFLFNSKPNR